MYQPFTTDTTYRGLLIARNAERARVARLPLYAQHDWLCHADGSPCGGGLADHCPVDPDRLQLLESAPETDESYPPGRDEEED